MAPPIARRILFTGLVALALAGCAGSGGFLTPVPSAADAPGTSPVEMVVATTRTKAESVASVAFSPPGFSGSFAGFGNSPTVRPNTAFTYRLSVENFRVAGQAQVGGYAIDNASNAVSRAKADALQSAGL